MRSGVFQLIAVLLSVYSACSEAVPSFARQTGMGCPVCHSPFPQLTEFGRQFKISGYTLSNGASDYPPLAVMLQPSFTRTAKSQPGADIPTFNRNDNIALTQGSVFYAGRLFGPYASALFGEQAAATADKFGIFFQTTYDGVEHGWAWDEFEIRFADTVDIAGHHTDYGLYINNNPTLQDPWNSTPAWNFPFSSSGLAPTPAAAVLIDGGVSQQVIGMGAYAKFDNGVYMDVGAYRTLSARVQSRVGVDPQDETQLAYFAPYWRLALEQTWGHQTWEIGTHGFAARTYPERDTSAGSDRLLDIGVDSQYQYIDGVHDTTIRFSWIHERQDWTASQELGLTEKNRGALRDFKFSASHLYDKTYGVTAHYFRINGDSDALLYADNRTNSPASAGWIFQFDYLPFNKNGGPAFWPASNIKFSLQYVAYRQFDGARKNFDGGGRDAADNNTLYLEAWIAF
jgi:hypothetical protein